jgi:hypothetical protein
MVGLSYRKQLAGICAVSRFAYQGIPHLSAWRSAMDESMQRAIKFLEKEIKTYMALSLFLSKKGIKADVRLGQKKVLVSSAYYKERMREAKKLVHELKKTN